MATLAMESWRFLSIGMILIISSISILKRWKRKRRTLSRDKSKSSGRCLGMIQKVRIRKEESLER